MHGNPTLQEMLTNLEADFHQQNELAGLNNNDISNLTAGKSGGATRNATTSTGSYYQPFLNYQYGQLFTQIQQINPTFSVARPNGPISQRDITSLQRILSGMRQPIKHQVTPYSFWPLNNGFLGGISSYTTLQKGYRFDRYGPESGSFVSPVGTPFGSRALPRDYINRDQIQYEVIRPFNTQSGTVAPAFGQPGFGTQHHLPVPVSTLLRLNYIREVK